jgi:hypothetical protein
MRRSRSRTVGRVSAPSCRSVAIRSIFSTCNAFGKEDFRHYPMFRHRSATPAGVTGNGEVRSLGDNVSSILGSVVNARADTTTASITAVGGQQFGAWSTQVKCGERP